MTGRAKLTVEVLGRHEGIRPTINETSYVLKKASDAVLDEKYLPPGTCGVVSYPDGKLAGRWKVESKDEED